MRLVLLFSGVLLAISFLAPAFPAAAQIGMPRPADTVILRPVETPPPPPVMAAPITPMQTPALSIVAPPPPPPLPSARCHREDEPVDGKRDPVCEPAE